MSTTPAPKLELRGVTKAFADKVVLDDISLEVGAHQVVCLIGASGSGKSTLLRCLNLLEPVDDGQIFLDGVDIAEPGLPPCVVVSAWCSRATTCSRT